MAYTISEILSSDRRGMEQVDALLRQEGIRRDANLDYTCGLMDDDYNVIATGSSFGNTLRCFAVDHRHQGEGLLNQVVTHLMDVQAQRGHLRLFLYTKPSAAQFFGDLGFHEIARVPDKLVFMENRRDGFTGYLRQLERTKKDGVSAAVVMNANPFTLGHQYLVESAASNCDALHLFIVSEDLSLFPFTVRRRLVEQGVAHIPNVILHDCGPYIISSATFPSYFLKDENEVIEGQARLDVTVFGRIAHTLNITQRWVGEEPFSQVTGLYNRVMSEALPEMGIQLHVVARRKADNIAISASAVRSCLKRGDFATLQALVPQTTLNYLSSPEAAPILKRIREAAEVVHY